MTGNCRFIALATGILLLFMAAPMAWADQLWHDTAELSYVDTRGNTEVSTLSVKNKLTYRVRPTLNLDWKLNVLYGQNDGVTSAERYETQLRATQTYTERLDAYVAADWLQDRFAGIDARYGIGAGGGYRFLTGPKHALKGEAGLSYTAEDYTTATDKSFIGGRLFGAYRYAFHEKSAFTQTLEWLPDLEDLPDWLFLSETAVTSLLADHFSLKISYNIRYDNEPVQGFEKTDSSLSAALVVEY